MRAWILILAIVAACPLSAQESDVYVKKIKPLLLQKCGACHSALKQESGLRLDAGKLILKGGDGGPVVQPGNIQESLIIERVTASDEDQRMPPPAAGEALTDAQLALLKNWIQNGAEIPNDETYLQSPRDHWAYQPVKRPSVPSLENDPVSNPIDAFLRDKQKSLGLNAAPMADEYTLIRRVYLDLIGLPPTRREIQSFVDRPSDRAWPQLIEDLLASPAYGERWGRHWMDVWRYSDWDGYKQELRGSQRHIWRWRDWIIKSLNEDKGYDQMVLEMLAADEAFPEDPAALAATGYLARNFHKSNRNIWLDATVEHVAKGFLGITINCARCHDHKYDPISQQAYYQLRAIFEPHQVRTDHVGLEQDLAKDGLPRAYDAEPDAKTYLYIDGNEKHPDKNNPMAPVPVDLFEVPFKIEPIELPVNAYYPALKDERVSTQLNKLVAEFKRVDQALSKLKSRADDEGNLIRPDAAELKRQTASRLVAELAVKSYRARWAADRALHRQYDPELIAELSQAAIDAEKERNIAQAQMTVLIKEKELVAAQAVHPAEPAKRKSAIAKAKTELAKSKLKLASAEHALKLTNRNYSQLGTVYPRISTGRRTARARWITHTDNPLTARVAVNQIWMRHFGEPLVENVFDFGLRTKRPVHAELLDWLAAELMQNDWSTKHIHRLILTSDAWRRASSGDSSLMSRNRELDPDNRYLWRMNSMRMDAEVVRDNLLAISNQLDPALGGPDIDFRQDQSSRRRSVYLRHAYEKQSTMLVTFDAANPTECYRRSESVIPQQALALINSSLSLEQARRLARQLWKEVADFEDANERFIDQAFLQILVRPATDRELEECQSFLSDQAKLLGDQAGLTRFPGGRKPSLPPSKDPTARARENLVHLLMNHNDFITIR